MDRKKSIVVKKIMSLRSAFSKETIVLLMMVFIAASAV
jgi:hypothetical protein